jgi:hypothetical protein
MGNFDAADAVSSNPTTRVISCDLAFVVAEPAEVVLQVAASRSAGEMIDQRLDAQVDGEPCLSSTEEVQHDPHGAIMQVLQARTGYLTVGYRAQIRAPERRRREPGTQAIESPGSGRPESAFAYEQQVYLRPSRYCPSDHLVGFAVAEFGSGGGVQARVGAITDWIRGRVGYVPGSSSVHDSAEDTLLTGMGSCRDFAHLGVALCRATGIPARFAAVYAPGLCPMDFHAVFEAYEDGRWYVHDATGLAPRPSLVRIVTGRDAADTAFASVTRGIATLVRVEVSATSGSSLPLDDHSEKIELD